MARKRRHYKRRVGATYEIDVTTFLNLMVVLVPFLLITAVFSRITILELESAAGESAQAPLQEIVGYTLTVFWSDLDQDGAADMIIGNDYMEPDIYYRGQSPGEFSQLAAGDAVPVSTLATMSIDAADFDNDLDLDLWDEVNGVFGAPVDLRMAFLSAESLDLGHGHSLDTDFAERIAHIIEAKGFYNGGDELHQSFLREVVRRCVC